MRFGLQFTAVFGVPLVYVLGDLRVVTPGEIAAYLPAPPAGRDFYLVPAGWARPFDEVFGAAGGG